MIELKIAVNNDLMIREDGSIGIRLSSDETNGLSLSNGLYADKDKIVNMNPIVNQDNGSLRVGYMGPYDSTQSQYGRISVGNIVHRIYTMDASGNYIDYRKLDTILPGDFIRKPVGDGTYEYYLVRNAQLGESSNGFLYNQVLQSDLILLGVW